MGMLKQYTQPAPGKSRTKQSFRDGADINKILAKHAKAGTLDHITQYGGQYGDFADFDFHEAQNRLAEATTIFDALPSEVRREFGNDPSKFFATVGSMSDEDLRKQIPALAEPGTQLPQVVRTPANVPEDPPEAPPADAPAAPAASE